MPDKAPPKPENKTDIPPKPKTDGKTAPKSTVKPALPEKKAEPPIKKPEPPPKSVSFVGLKDAVNLPQPGKPANEAVSLGSFDLDPTLALDLQLQLLGGDTVAKGNPKFALQKDGEGPTSGWKIEMAEKNSKDAVKIARLWQDENEWKIQWDPAAKDKATLLRYCGLQFSCQKTKRFVALTKPKSVPPLFINVDAGVARPHLSKDFLLPDPSVLRLQVLDLDPSMPKHVIKVMEAKGHAGKPPRGKAVELVLGDTVPAKGHVIVGLSKDDNTRVYLDIDFDVRGKELVIEMRGGCDISGGGTLLFSTKKLQEADARISMFLQMVSEMEKIKNAPKPPAEKVQEAKKAKDEVKALGDFAEELRQTASIPFRVYAVLGAGDGEAASRVIIFQSGQFENPKAGGKKNPKGNKKGHALDR